MCFINCSKVSDHRLARPISFLSRLVSEKRDERDASRFSRVHWKYQCRCFETLIVQLYILVCYSTSTLLELQTLLSVLPNWSCCSFTDVAHTRMFTVIWENHLLTAWSQYMGGTFFNEQTFHCYVWFDDGLY